MLLTTNLLSEKINVSPRTLERWRVDGQGPPFLKAGRKVLYYLCDVEAWLFGTRRFSTSEVVLEPPPHAGLQKNYGTNVPELLA